MQVSKVLIILSLLAIVIGSCQKELNLSAYESFCSNPENGLRKEADSNGFLLSVKYEPSQLLIGRQGLSNIEAEDYGVDNYEHFQFQIKLISGGNILLHNETPSINEVTRINHFSFNAKNDFYLIQNEDTVACDLAHYSRNYNLSPTIDLSLAFPKIDKISDWQFVYTDKQFNIGRTKFMFKAEDLKNLPELKQ